LRGGTWTFYKLLESTYKRSLTRADSIINKLLQKPFDFTVSEYATFSRDDDFTFAADVNALTARWSKYLKLRALDQFYDIAAEDSTGKTSITAVTGKSEIKVRERMKQVETKALKKLLENPAGVSNFVYHAYLNAIAAGFDPHTNYFSNEGKEKFESGISAEVLSFGVELDRTETGEIIIENLVPGGSAWKSGDLNEGDVLISLQWEGREGIEMAGLSLEDAYEILEHNSNERLVFEVRKKDGTKRTTLLRKEKIEHEENIVKGFLLNGERKIGYIVLPAFYTEWENESGSSCANDVAKEIVKLKKENIEGLVLDVRFNGGGSLHEALEMIGIFVDEGPLVGHKLKTGRSIYLKDPNRGMIFNGPLALMVNGQSASASEILAASLQDYNRALIVGSKTYWKATMQQMMVLDTITSRPLETARAKDIVKITTGKLYRLTGETAQLNSVSPDIPLPDAFDGLDYRERFSAFALVADTIAKNAYYKPLRPLPVSELARKSGERVNAVEEFQLIKKMTGMLRGRSKTEMIPLKAEAFEVWARMNDAQDKTVKGFPAQKTIAVDNHSLDKAAMANNNYAKELNREWLRDIAEDIYIRETYFILCDLINLKQPQNQ
jgi:carboxyl-terminal processing protease